LLILVLWCGIAGAAPKTFVREYTYHAGENDSRVTARSVATNEMRNILLREVGEYLHGERKISNEEYSEKIEAITAGVVEMKVLNEDWSRWADFLFDIKAEMTVDPDDVNARIADVLNDKQKTKELEDARQRTLAAEAEVERLKKELEQAKSRGNIAAQTTLQTTYQQQTDRLSAEDYFLRAYNASENGAFEQSVEYYNQALEMDSEFAAAYNNAGVSLQRMNRFADAIKYFGRAIDIDPTLAAAYNNTGNALYRQRRFGEAVDYYQKAIDLDPANAMAYNNIGVAYKDLKQYEQAIDYFNQAIEIAPADAMAYCNMGNVYQNQQDYAQAIAWYEQSVAVDSLYANGWYNMGAAYDKLKQYPQAALCYQKAAAIDKYDATACYSAGLAHQNMGNYEDAVEWYGKAIAADPNFLAAYSGMGNAYFKLGNPDKQAECYAEAARRGDTKVQKWLENKGYDWKTGAGFAKEPELEPEPEQNIATTAVAQEPEVAKSDATADTTDTADNPEETNTIAVDTVNQWKYDIDADEEEMLKDMDARKERLRK
jgi:superkiller protein 3